MEFDVRNPLPMKSRVSLPATLVSCQDAHSSQRGHQVIDPSLLPTAHAMAKSLEASFAYAEASEDHRVRRGDHRCSGVQLSWQGSWHIRQGSIAVLSGELLSSPQ